MKIRFLMACCVIHFFVAGCTVRDTGTKLTAQLESERLEVNKALVRKWFDEVINRRNLDAIADIFAENYIHYGPEGVDIQGRDAARAFAASILAASDDRHGIVEQQVAEGDLVVTHFTSRGRHTGVFRGIEPTGKIWITKGICISRIKDGRIVEDWEIIHNSGL